MPGINLHLILKIFIGLIIGTILGFIIYILTISNYFIKINVKVIKTIKLIVIKIIWIIVYPLKLLLKPISFVIINITNFDKKIKNIIKKSYGKKDFKNKCRKI